MNKRLLNVLAVAAFAIVPLSLSAQKVISEYKPTSLYDEGLMLFNNKHYGAAIKAFEQYRAATDDQKSQLAVSALYYEAVSSLYLNNADGAQKILTFVNENPGSSYADQANFLYANVLMREREYREALAIYEKVDPASLSERESQELQFNMAYSYFQTGEAEKSLPLFKAGIDNNTMFREQSLYYYGHIQYILGNDDEALGCMTQLRDNQTYGKVVPVYELQINYKKGDCDYVMANGDRLLEKSEKRRKGEVANIVADCYYKSGNYARALEYYNVYQQNRRREIPRGTHFQIGVCQMNTNRTDEAINTFLRIANQTDSIGQYCYYYLALCYSTKEQNKFARTAFLNAYKCNFNKDIAEDALFNYVKLSFIPGVDPFNEALNVLRNYIKENPSSPRINEATELEIHLLLNAKDYNTAISMLENEKGLSAEMKNMYSRLLFAIATEQFVKNDFGQAQKYFGKVLENDKAEKRCEARFWLAESMFRSGNKTGAREQYLLFVNNPQAKQMPIYPTAFYNIAYIDYLADNYSEAISWFEKYLKTDNKDEALASDSYLRVGDCYFIQREYGKAVMSYATAIQSNSKSADYALYQQGLSYGAQGKTGEKIESLQSLVSNYSRSKYYDKALYEIGSSYLADNNTQSAINTFERLIYERPRSLYTRQALMKIGMMYYNSNQSEQALERLKKLVSDYPNTDESREALNVIKSIYMEQNRIEEYFAYVKTIEGQQITINQQDSLAFATAEVFYEEGDYQKSYSALTSYLVKYPDGAYQLKAHQYSLDCMSRIGSSDDPLPHLLYIIGQPANDYTDNALMRIARMEFDGKAYDSASVHYERLSNVTEEPLLKLEALEGCMKSRYFLHDYDKAIAMANELRGSADITPEQSNHISYILGKSYYEKQQFDKAVVELDKCAASDRSVNGAECAFLSIQTSYNMQQYTDAENKVFAMSEDFSYYNYWVAKAFIVLSDVYVAQQNYFQAKETLRSIIDNYDGEELRTIAQDKFKAIKDIEPSEEQFENVSD